MNHQINLHAGTIKQLEEAVNTLLYTALKVNQSEAVLPLNIYIYGPPGVGKTTTVIAAVNEVFRKLQAENHPLATDINEFYKFFIGNPAANPEEIVLGPIDVEALVKDNEYKRNPKYSVVGDNKVPVVVVDEFDTLSQAVLEAFKAALTVPMKVPRIVIAIANASLEQVLLTAGSTMNQGTRDAIADRFPCVVEFDPEPPNAESLVDFIRTKHYYLPDYVAWEIEGETQQVSIKSLAQAAINITRPSSRKAGVLLVLLSNENVHTCIAPSTIKEINEELVNVLAAKEVEKITQLYLEWSKLTSKCNAQLTKNNSSNVVEIFTSLVEPLKEINPRAALLQNSLVTLNESPELLEAFTDELFKQVKNSLREALSSVPAYAPKDSLNELEQVFNAVNEGVDQLQTSVKVIIGSLLAAK